MMTPLRCVRRGGDQERVSVRVVAEIVQFRGGPLGTKTISNFQAIYYLFTHRLVE